LAISLLTSRAVAAVCRACALRLQAALNSLNVGVLLLHVLVRPYRSSDRSHRSPALRTSSYLTPAKPALLSTLLDFRSWGADNVLDACSLFALCFLFDPSAYLQVGVALLLCLAAGAYAVATVRKSFAGRSQGAVAADGALSSQSMDEFKARLLPEDDPSIEE
jgi:hypothetical protein